MTYFYNFFTVGLSSKFATRSVLDFPPHHRVIMRSSIHWNVQLATWQMVHLPCCQLHISVNRTAQIYLELYFCVELHTKKALECMI